MEEGNLLPLRADAGRFVDEPDACLSTAIESGIQIGDGKADVMDAGSATRHERGDRRVVSLGFEELDERVTSGETRDVGAVGIVERNLFESEDVAIERKDLIERAHGDADVGNARAA